MELGLPHYYLLCYISLKLAVCCANTYTALDDILKKSFPYPDEYVLHIHGVDVELFYKICERIRSFKQKIYSNSYNKYINNDFHRYSQEQTNVIITPVSL